MAYSLKITELPKGKTIHTQIEELKEMKIYLEQFKDKPIGIEVIKLKTKRKS